MHLLSDAPLRQGDGAVQAYRGIKFASCERFGLPQLVPFEEPRCGDVVSAGDSPTEASTAAATFHVSTSVGTMCPQRAGGLESLFGSSAVPAMAEDALYLSIYTPATIPSEEFGKLPVAVWVHGGAFLSGGSEEPRYGLERLVQAGHCIGVKISYRLGALGWLYLPEHGAVNLGLEDQKAALQWIQLHIAAFGGDPSRVTLFGQSAGAQSIAALIASGCGKTLFNQAVLQSAPIGLHLSSRQASRVTRAYIQELHKVCGCTSDDWQMLQTASTEQILLAQDAVLKRNLVIGLTFMPVLDCTVLPADQTNTKTSDNISCRPLPQRVVAGTQSHDAIPFVPSWLADFGTWLIFSHPAGKYLAKLRRAGVGTSSYRLSWHPAGSRMGACHCMELPFILGVYDDWKDATMLRGMSRSDFDRLSAQYLRAWASFINGGVFSFKDTDFER